MKSSSGSRCKCVCGYEYELSGNGSGSGSMSVSVSVYGSGSGSMKTESKRQDPPGFIARQNTKARMPLVLPLPALPTETRVTWTSFPPFDRR